MWKNAKVLVTGGAGFVGTNLSLKLMEKGALVTATYHKQLPKISAGIHYIQADLTEKEDCERIMQGAEYLFMTAAYVPGAQGVKDSNMEFVTEPTIMNLRILEAAAKAGVNKICFVSSSNTYPFSEEPLKEEQFLEGEPFEAYYFVGWHKRFSEILCQMYAEKMRKMKITVVKLDNIYGPYDNFEEKNSHVTASLIRKVVGRQSPIEVWGSGEAYKDFIYIEDAVKGILLSMEKSEKQFDIFNIASGCNVTINHLLHIIVQVNEGYDLKIIHNLEKPETIPFRKISIEKAQKILGFQPDYSLEEGIRKTVEWYRNYRISDTV